MDSHDPERIATGQSRQYWRAFWPVMHLHENHYTKRASVAGIRARANKVNAKLVQIFWCWHIIVLIY
ncbi:hypothetical protein C4Y57_001935 [Klebsiella variicola]|nr:hypothetical protein [Klebsiella variicola]PXM05438.1 hypothetical protein DMT40_19055 [Klebsiella variicola]ROG47987.1 hypothetical protein C4Y57_001935 [Klebsiella variicola]